MSRQDWDRKREKRRRNGIFLPHKKVKAARPGSRLRYILAGRLPDLVNPSTVSLISSLSGPCNALRQ